jgi:hypothetical protein
LRVGSAEDESLGLIERAKDATRGRFSGLGPAYVLDQVSDGPLQGCRHGGVSEGVVETVIPARRSEGTRSTPGRPAW